MRTRVMFSLFLLFALTIPKAVFAQESAPPDFDAAKRHFKAGQEFLQMDRYADAVVEFKKAYQITKDGLVMGQVAEAYAKASDYEAALASIKVYRDALPEGDRASAEQLIKEYEKAIREGRSKKLILSTDQPPPSSIPPTDQTQSNVAQETPPSEAPPEGQKKRIYTWIAAGTAGALVLSAMVLGLNAQSKYDDLANECKPNCAASDVDSVKTRALVTDILWGTAAAAAVTAGILYWLEGRNMPAEEEGPATDSDDMEEEVLSRVRIAPVIGGGTYGMSAGVRF